METVPVNEICQQMDKVRRNLGDEVDEIVESAQTLTDWRYYIKTHPWMCLAGAAALGYFIVPKRMVVFGPSAEMIEEAIKRSALAFKPPPAPPPKSGLTSAIFGMLTNVALRHAMNYASANAEKFFKHANTKGASHEEQNRR